MAEITEIHDGNSLKQDTKTRTGEEEAENRSKDQSMEELVTESEFDPTKMRKTRPGKKRLVLTLSVLFSFVLGLPFLIKSVEIYRSPLPFRDIDSLSTVIESEPVLFPCQFQAVFVRFDSNSGDRNHAQTLGSSIANEMKRLVGESSNCGSCGNNFTVSVAIDGERGCIQDPDVNLGCSWQCNSLKGFDLNVNLKEDELFDEFLGSALVGGEKCSDYGGKKYSVVVVNRDDDVKAVVGKYRHGWIVGKVSEEDAVKKIAEIFVQVFINGGKEEGSIRGEFMPVGADGKVVLSFSLLNADPSDWIYDWDFQRVDEVLLTPVVQALKPIANISIESQILYHTPKSFSSHWDKKSSSYIFNTKDLPFFVNSNEWHLDTAIEAGGRSKILHIIVYVPSANECPLLLKLPNGEISSTNSFISPMWGGVIVWNPPSCSRSSESNQPAKHIIPFQDLQNVVEVFMGQLRQLFGLKSENFYQGVTNKVNFLASEKGFTEWELDLLSRHHTCFNLLSCATTLGSLSRLVQSLPRMIIMDEIGKQVEFSLEAAKLAQSNASDGIYSASAVSSLQARSLAEDAFYHPSIMSVSHSSFEHYFAVYSPFFLPVTMHVLLAAVREWKRYKVETKKYLAWKQTAEASS